MAKYADLDDIGKLRALFKKNDWNKNPNEDAVFENFCHLLNNLTVEAKELIHELSQNFLWMTGADYEKEFINLIGTINDPVITACRKVHLVPLVKPSDRKKTKSSNHCIYLLRPLLSSNPKFRNKEITLSEDFENIVNYEYASDGNEIIFLVDDFVGTGDAFLKCWEDINKNQSITVNNTFLVTLVIQELAHRRVVEETGMKVLYSLLRNKGISDFFPSPIKEEKIRIMQQIEKMIEPGQYKFGYKKSEALVKMINTPNNTFPVFWKGYTVKDEAFKAPFNRD